MQKHLLNVAFGRCPNSLSLGRVPTVLAHDLHNSGTRILTSHPLMLDPKKNVRGSPNLVN